MKMSQLAMRPAASVVLISWSSWEEAADFRDRGLAPRAASALCRSAPPELLVLHTLHRGKLVEPSAGARLFRTPDCAWTRGDRFESMIAGAWSRICEAWRRGDG